MYQLDKSILEMDRSQLITELIRVHEFNFKPRYSTLLNYYNGEHEAIKKKKAAKDKVNNKITNPFPALIVNTVQGYLLGQPVKYSSDDSKALESVKDVLYNNDEEDANSEILKTVSTCGEAFEYVYVNEDKEVEFVQLDPRETLVVYDNSLKPKILLALRYYKTKDFNNKETSFAELYTDSTIEYYFANNGSLFKLTESYDHAFGQVPVVHYRNNEEETGDFEKIISLIDDYDKALSLDADELEQFRNAYMILKGFGKLDKDFYKNIRDAGAICIPSGNNSNIGAEFLTKNANTDSTHKHLEVVVDNIHKFSQVPNFTDPKAGTADSGVAIKQRTWGFEQLIGVKQRKIEKGLFQRLRLILQGIYQLGGPVVDPNTFSLTFSRNLPSNVKEDAEVLQLLGLTQDILNEDALKDVLANVSIIEDPQEAAKSIKKTAEENQIKADKAAQDALDAQKVVNTANNAQPVDNTKADANSEVK